MSQDTDLYMLTHGRVITMGPNLQVIDDGAVLVQGARIAQVGSTAELTLEHPEVPQVDLSSKVLMPGMINIHDHLYSALARGISMTGPAPQNFVEILERLWWRLDSALTEEDVRYSALLGFMEAVKRGTTTIIDHHASPSAIEGSLDQLAGAARQVGLRGCFCYEVTDRHGPDGARQGVEENARFLRRCAEQNDSFLAGAFGLHASFTVGPNTLRQCLEAAPTKDTVFHVHVAEDRADVEHSRSNYGAPALQRLLGEGLQNFPILAAHCIHLEESEYALLSEHDVTVLHNPESNMNNAVGCAAVRRLLQAGVRVGLGTDGMTQDMFLSLRTLPLAHRLVALHPQAFGYDEIYRIVFGHNRAIAERFFPLPLGRIEAGAAADLVVLDYDPPTPLDSGNVVGHLLFGLGASPVHHTIVGGSFVVREGRVLSVDEEEVSAHCRELARKLWLRW